MGAAMAIKKSFNFAAHNSVKVWFSNTVWPGIGGFMDTVSNFRYLGAHIRISGRSKNTTLGATHKKAVAYLKKVSQLPTTTAKKAAIIRAKVLPAAMCGIEATNYTERQLVELTAAMSKVVSTSNKSRHNLDHMFQANSHGPDYTRLRT